MTSITFFFIFIPILAGLLLAVNLLLAPHNSYQEKASAFECGFHSFLGQNRTQFSISFFIFALLFLLFDLEILLVYPYVVSAYANSLYGLVIMLIFFLALTLGFAFELGKNALKIDSRQGFTISKSSTLYRNVSTPKYLYKINNTREFLRKNNKINHLLNIQNRYITTPTATATAVGLTTSVMLPLITFVLVTIGGFVFCKLRTHNTITNFNFVPLLVEIASSVDTLTTKMKDGSWGDSELALLDSLISKLDDHKIDFNTNHPHHINFYNTTKELLQAAKVDSYFIYTNVLSPEEGAKAIIDGLNLAYIRIFTLIGNINPSN